jgi:hypothetical protein
MNTPGLTTLLVAAALPVAAETITFDKEPVGGLPAGWVAGVTGRGAPKWAIEADGTAPVGVDTVQIVAECGAAWPHGSRPHPAGPQFALGTLGSMLQLDNAELLDVLGAVLILSPSVLVSNVHFGSGPTLSSFLIDVMKKNVSAAREERPGRCNAVGARADDSRGLRVGAAERLRREHRSGACPQRRHGACVENGAQRSVRRVRKEHEPHHRRQPLSRIARERRHPFQKGMSASERGHRAEVPGGVGGHVDLRRHRPLAARIRHERVADGLERALGRDCGSNLLRRKDGYATHTDLTAAISFSIAAFASSNSITVFGS